MKNFVTIFFVVLLGFSSLTPQGSISELNKINFLIQHYQEHLQLEPQGVNFIDFLLMHYSLNSEHRQEKHNTNLPHFGNFHSGYYFLVHYEAGILPLPIPVNETKLNYQDIFYHFLPAIHFFQPPRV